MKKQELFFSIDQFSVKYQLGEGYSSKVYLVQDQLCHHYALKVFHPSPANHDLALNEISILGRLAHPNVVALLAYNLDATQVRTKVRHNKLKATRKHKIIIVFEFVSNGELFDYIKSEGRLGEETAKLYFSDILNTLEYLSSRQVSHKDLKPENILLDDQMGIKLIDFGFAEGGEESTARFQGTKSYMSPEMLEKKAYSRERNDLFSLGVILFIMVVGWPPFGMACQSDPHYRLLISSNYPRFWQVHHRQLQVNSPATLSCSEGFMSLIQSMLHPSPEQRLSLPQLKQHPWLS